MKLTSLNINNSRRRLLQTAGLLTLLCALAMQTVAQQGQVPAGAQPAPQPQPAPGGSSGKETLGPTADTIHPYRPYNHDPFKKPMKPKTPKEKAKQVALQLGFPAIDARRAEFRQKVDEARKRGLTEPPPVTQYLVNELDVTGVFHDDRGYGVFVRAQPTGTMLFLRGGEHCYNGEIARIEGDDAGGGTSRVFFREFYKVDQNGKATTQERMVVKTPSVPKQQ